MASQMFQHVMAIFKRYTAFSAHICEFPGMFNFVYLQLTHKGECLPTLAQKPALHILMFIDVLAQAIGCRVTFVTISTFVDLFMKMLIMFTYFLSCVTSNIAQF